MHLGFVGAGNMASAIVEGALGGRLFAPEEICLSARHETTLAPFADRGMRVTLDNREVARFADIVVLAVKPQQLDAVLGGLTGLLTGKCVVSIAAGISKAYLRAHLGEDVFLVRAMPNTPLAVGCGATALTPAENVPAPLYEAVTALFAAAGETAVLDESLMNAVIGVSGSSPAFFFRMADAMVATAAEEGIDPDVALRLAAKAMEGSARMLLQSGKTAEALTRAVCSPGGTTLAALTAFDELDFEGLIREAMLRSARRAEELGK